MRHYGEQSTLSPRTSHDDDEATQCGVIMGKKRNRSVIFHPVCTIFRRFQEQVTWQYPLFCIRFSPYKSDTNEDRRLHDVSNSNEFFTISQAHFTLSMSTTLQQCRLSNGLGLLPPPHYSHQLLCRTETCARLTACVFACMKVCAETLASLCRRCI